MKIDSQMSVENVESLSWDHEEADTRLLFHAANMGYTNAVIRTPCYCHVGWPGGPNCETTCLSRQDRRISGGLLTSIKWHHRYYLVSHLDLSLIINHSKTRFLEMS